MNQNLIRMCFQNSQDEISETEEKGKKISLLSILIKKTTEVNEVKFHPEQFIFENQIQKKISKQYLSVLSPEKQEEKKILTKNYEMKRSKDQQRKDYKQEIDQLRDQTEKRKKMHRDLDQDRDLTEKRRNNAKI